MGYCCIVNLRLHPNDPLIALVKALLELSLEEKSVYILFRFSFEVLYTKTPARVGYFPIPYSGPE